jgi:hypothetical protein
VSQPGLVLTNTSAHLHHSLIGTKTICWNIYWINAVLLFLGMAIGPAIAGIYMQKHQASISDISGSFQSAVFFIFFSLTENATE